MWLPWSRDWRPPMSKVSSRCLGLGADAIGVPEVVDFRIELDAVIDFVACDEATAPTAGDELITEPVAGFAVEIDGPQFGRYFHRR